MIYDRSLSEKPKINNIMNAIKSNHMDKEIVSTIHNEMILIDHKNCCFEKFSKNSFFNFYLTRNIYL